MSLKENLINTKNKIISIRDGLIQTLKDKNVTISADSTLSDAANAVKNIELSGAEVNVTLGQIDENGNFQPLQFDGTTASVDGEAESPSPA